jgi:putative ABC transport system permease protein
MNVTVRTAQSPRDLEGVIRKQIASVDRDQPVTNVQTLDEVLAASVSQRQLTLVLLAVFAGMALVLAALGIYGVMAYSVAQRTREIGIRCALGASRKQIFGQVLLQASGIAASGIAAGIAMALGLTRLISSLLFQVSPFDVPTFLGIALLFTAVTLAASYMPARRAMRVDPVIALRYE